MSLAQILFSRFAHSSVGGLICPRSSMSTCICLLSIPCFGVLESPGCECELCCTTYDDASEKFQIPHFYFLFFAIRYAIATQFRKCLSAVDDASQLFSPIYTLSKMYIALRAPLLVDFHPILPLATLRIETTYLLSNISSNSRNRLALLDYVLSSISNTS